MNTCDKCQFWERAIDDGMPYFVNMDTAVPSGFRKPEILKFGYCKRYAPRGKDGFPTTQHNDWCGDFQLAQSQPSTPST